MNYNNLKISEIAKIISKDWKNVYFGAKPYLQAMYSLSSIKDNYMSDSGESVIAYFLSNASQWKGDVAKEIKKELNNRLKKGDNIKESYISKLIKLIESKTGKKLIFIQESSLTSLNKEREDLLSDMDMDTDIETTGGKVSDNYGKKLNVIDEKIKSITNKISDLELQKEQMEDAKKDINKLQSQIDKHMLQVNKGIATNPVLNNLKQLNKELSTITDFNKKIDNQILKINSKIWDLKYK